jgi:hypothetical protein
LQNEGDKDVPFINFRVQVIDYARAFGDMQPTETEIAERAEIAEIAERDC